MGCPAKQEATRVCWRERETGARSKGSGRPLSERTLVRPVCHRQLSQPKGSDLHNVESRPLRLRTLVRVQLSPLPPVIGRAFFSLFSFWHICPRNRPPAKSRQNPCAPTFSSSQGPHTSQRRGNAGRANNSAMRQDSSARILMRNKLFPSPEYVL